MSITQTQAPRVILADDQKMLRDCLRAILTESGFDIVAEASDGREAVRLAQSVAHDISILDISMPVLNGIDAADEILKGAPASKILILTMYTDDRYIRASLRAGVSGFLVKSKAASFLVEAIRTILRGEVYECSAATWVVAKELLDKDEIAEDALSEREREVLRLIAEGKNAQEIGDDLGVSSKTVNCHRARIMQKLRVYEVAGLVRYAIREGLA